MGIDNKEGEERKVVIGYFVYFAKNILVGSIVIGQCSKA